MFLNFKGDYMPKKKNYTYWDKLEYYRKKAKNQYKQNFYQVKYEDRNWWKYYYYQNRFNGLDHKEAYLKATEELLKLKKDDKKTIKNFLKIYKGDKIPEEKIDPLEISLFLFEQDVNKLRKKLSKKKG